MTEKPGMRLVAMIEENDGKYQVINFLPDIKIKYIKDKEFEVIEDEDYLKIPYAPGIDDLTVIVGENGVGKTRLVNDVFGINKGIIYIYYKDDRGGFNLDNIYSYCIIEGIILRYKTETISLYTTDLAGTLYSFPKVIKYSHTIELSTVSSTNNVDVSSSESLHQFDFNSCLIFDMDKQIKFLLSEFAGIEKIEEMLGFSGKQLSFVFNKKLLNYDHYDSKLQDKLYYTMDSFGAVEEQIMFLLTDYFATIYAEEKLKKTNQGKLDYTKILEKRDTIVIDDSVAKVIRELIEEAPNYTGEVNDYIAHELSSIEGEIAYVVKVAAYKSEFESFSFDQRINELKKVIEQKSIEVVDQIDELFNYSGNHNDAILNLKDHVFFKPLQIVFDKSENKASYLIEGIERINHFLELHHKIIEDDNFLVIWGDNGYQYIFIRTLVDAILLQWQGLSSGQLALLNIFGRLYSLPKEVKEKRSLLLLDEVDLGLHPEWQRKWVSTALPIIGEIFKGKHVQIIMTTHSPIMLSDIYRENVIFLRRNKESGSDSETKTFGQNIYTLFKSSFFLEELMGEYAYQLIGDTIKVLQDLKNSGLENIRYSLIVSGFVGKYKISIENLQISLKKIIESVGEPIIANQLWELYDEVFSDKERRHQEIEMLEARLKELRGRV